VIIPDPKYGCDARTYKTRVAGQPAVSCFPVLLLPANRSNLGRSDFQVTS
jgi:hypothetical protein